MNLIINFFIVLITLNVITCSKAKAMESCKVLVTAPNAPESGIKLLNSSCTLIISDELPYPTKDDIIKKASGVDAIFWVSKHYLDSSILDAAGPSLKVIGAMSAGTDNIDKEELKKRGIKLSNTPYVLDDSVAEVAMMLALAAGRRLQEGRRDIETGKWVGYGIDYLLRRDIKHSTVGVVGLGNVGIATAKKFKALNATKILYSGHTIKEEGNKIGAEFVPFEQLLKESDYVIVSCPLTNETRHMFNDDAFSKMKKTAVLINVARGEIVDQSALVRALQNNTIFAAGLDVMTPEPLPTDDILLSLPNCVISPHIGSATERTRNAMSELAAQNILRALGGEPMFTPVLP